jgi:alkanesulfonate monooxygenase SsuD/methylene tetrahydromethanopterin reductase-like flavin-dependent oxidoreductase (luciferase family)
MRVLFDNGTPRGVATCIAGHVVEEARSRGWDALKNGELLVAAEAAGFDVLVTTDQAAIRAFTWATLLSARALRS